jgi:hypothetical protein
VLKLLYLVIPKGIHSFVGFLGVDGLRLVSP